MQPRLAKEMGLTATALSLTLGEFFVAAQGAAAAVSGGGIAWIIGALSLLWLLAMALALALVRHKAAVAALVTGPPLIALAMGRFTAGALGGALLLLISLWLAQRSYWYEQQSRIAYRTSHLFGVGTKTLTIGLILALAGLALPAIEGKIEREGLAIDERYVEFVVRPLTPLIEGLLPNYNSTASIDELIDSQIAAQGSSEILNEAQRAQIRQQIAAQFGQSIEGKETLGHLVTLRLNASLEKITRANAFTVSLVVIVLAFLTLRAAVPLIVWPLLGGIAFLVWGLRSVGLMRLQETNTTVQRLEM
jgi:hypothetical protein